ncbi:proton pump-interactor 1-like [Trifolium pratense]|uniref:proton pump-interactor 1-like n=1 Tax=Trifolium pratense TaxID=57577 RepID=UPI001E6943AA|nr:proton pump-interactor 1-like [Trifolium pratense]
MEIKEDNSEHVSKHVHQFYFVKLWPTTPDSICKIKKEENIVMKMKQDICKISDIIAKKTVRRDSLYDRYHGVSTEETILSNLNMALDELNLRNVKVENGGWFGEKLDRKSLNYKKLHGSKSLGEEKRILRDIKIQQKDVASFKSLEVLNESLWGKHYIYHGWEKLVREIEQFQNQPMERASKYDNLKKTIKNKIKRSYDYKSLNNKRECGTEIITGVKKFEANKRDLYPLNAKLTRKYNKKDEANQRILKLKKLYHEEIHDYYQYCSLIDKVHQLAEEKDVAALEEMSSSEGGKFMLEWNNNKAFRQDYETKVLRSLERRQLSRDGRRRPDKSCCLT